jgi:hypothetical protein
VLLKWKAFMKPEPRAESGEPKPTLRDSVANLSEEVVAKDREIESLQGAHRRAGGGAGAHGDG